MVDIKNTIKNLYAYIFGIGLIANAQALFLNTDATDSIRAYGSTQALMTSGRFVGHYLDIIFEQLGFYFPFRYINILLYIAYTAMAVIFILLIFNVKDRLRGCLIGAIIMTSAVNSGVLVYYYVAHMYGFCLLISMISAYLLLNKKMTVIPALLLALSLGIYQAYLATVVLVIFLYQFIAITNKKVNVKVWFSDVIRCALTSMVALIIYILANKLALNLSGLSMAGYLNMSSNVVPSYQKDQIIKLLFESYMLIYHLIFTAKYFFCDNIVIRLCIAASFISFLWLYVALLMQQKSIAKRCWLIILFLLLPCIINLPMFISAEVPERISLNWYFIFVIPILLSDVTQTDQNRKYNIIIQSIHRHVTAVMIVTVTVASLYSTYRNVNIYTSMSKANTLAEDIVDDIEHRIAECDGFTADKELCFVGILDTEITNGMFFNVEYSEYLYKLFNRDYSSIFKRYALLNYKYLTPDDKRVKTYSTDDIKNGTAMNKNDEFFCVKDIHVGFPTIHSNNDTIKRMPSYPSYGCVQEVNGTIIIKLSN